LRVVVPATDGDGMAVNLEFMVDVDLLSAEELEAFNVTSPDAEARALLATKIRAWTDVLDCRGQPVSCTPANIAAVLNIQAVFIATWVALLTASYGMPAPRAVAAPTEVRH
jgi:hypothetical protein